MVDQAIDAPVSLPGIVAMVLLAYTIFTITMVLQRKEAARGLALGLATLTIPAVPLLLLGPVPAVAIVPAVLGVLLFLGLRRPSVEGLALRAVVAAGPGGRTRRRAADPIRQPPVPCRLHRPPRSSEARPVSKQSRTAPTDAATPPTHRVRRPATTHPAGPLQSAAPRPRRARRCSGYRGRSSGSSWGPSCSSAGRSSSWAHLPPHTPAPRSSLPSPAPAAAPDATPRLGQVTRDLGRAHVATGERVTYEFCPPTSGAHYNDEPDGPIPTRFYGSKETALPQGWIHNLEHGQMTVLYRCPEGCDETVQAALAALQRAAPSEPSLRLPRLGVGCGRQVRRPAHAVRRARLGAGPVPRLP